MKQEGSSPDAKSVSTLILACPASGQGEISSCYLQTTWSVVVCSSSRNRLRQRVWKNSKQPPRPRTPRTPCRLLKAEAGRRWSDQLQGEQQRGGAREPKVKVKVAQLPVPVAVGTASANSQTPVSIQGLPGIGRRGVRVQRHHRVMRGPVGVPEAPGTGTLANTVCGRPASCGEERSGGGTMWAGPPRGEPGRAGGVTRGPAPASPLRTARGSPLRRPQRRRPAPVAVKSAATPTLCPSGLRLPLQDSFLQVPVKDTWPSWGHGGDGAGLSTEPPLRDAAPPSPAPRLVPGRPTASPCSLVSGGGGGRECRAGPLSHQDGQLRGRPGQSAPPRPAASKAGGRSEGQEGLTEHPGSQL